MSLYIFMEHVTLHLHELTKSKCKYTKNLLISITIILYNETIYTEREGVLRSRLMRAEYATMH